MTTEKQRPANTKPAKWPPTDTVGHHFAGLGGRLDQASADTSEDTEGLVADGLEASLL